MKEKNIGVSLKKIIENGELLAQNIDRGVNIVKSKNTLESVEKVVKKVSAFYDSIIQIKLSSDNRRRVINIFKAVYPALDELKNIKNNILSNQNKVKTSPSV